MGCWRHSKYWSSSINQSVQSLSRVWVFVTPWTAARQASLPFTISRSLLKLMSVESMMSSNHLVLCRPHVQLFVTPWTASYQSSLSFTVCWSLFKFMSIELVMQSKHLILCCPLLLLPSIFHSIRVFSSESAFCIMWPKYWSISFSMSPYNEYSELISLGLTDCISLLSKALSVISSTTVWKP